MWKARRERDKVECFKVQGSYRLWNEDYLKGVID